MKTYWWKLQFATIIMVRAKMPWNIAWPTAECYIDMYGTDDSPYDAVQNEINCWGE